MRASERLGSRFCDRANRTLLRATRGLVDGIHLNEQKSELKPPNLKFSPKTVGFPGEPYSLVLSNIFKELEPPSTTYWC